MLLFGLWGSKFAKKNGSISRMMTSTDAEGVEHDEESFATELVALRDGQVKCFLPNDIVGGVDEWELEVEYQGSSADLLGCAQVGHFPESFVAAHCCKDCWWHSQCWCAHATSATLPRKQQTHAPGCHGQDAGMRTPEEHSGNLQKLRSSTFTSKVKRADAYRAAGVGKLYAALDYIPGARPTDDLKHDVMHLFFCGISPKESFQMLEYFTTTGVFTWDDLNVSRKHLKVESGHTIPELARPNTDGKAKKSIGMAMTAADCMHWVVNRCAEPH